MLTYQLTAARTAKTLPGFINKTMIISLALLAVILHASALSQDLFLSPGLNLGITNAASLISCLIAALLVVASISIPVMNLSIIALPTAAFTLLVEQIFPSSHMMAAEITRELKFHILISILAYSMLTIAAGQAILVAFQDRHLRKKRPGGIIRSLPPLQTMESLLFQMIATGFALHTIALGTGIMYIDHMFAKPLMHKTLLSIIAWCIFAVLLWGRHYHGWRGRTAIRWTMSGFVLLFLSYFGTKLVLEVILGK
jgi:ABC-type uncharacterized transport system permease subunit